MKDYKGFFSSRTIWANIAAMLAMIAQFMGWEPVDVGGLTEHFMLIVSGVSSLAGMYFRYIASAKLTLGGE